MDKGVNAVKRLLITVVIVMGSWGVSWADQHTAALCTAAWKGDEIAVSRLIKAGADVNVYCDGGARSPLHIAVDVNNPQKNSHLGVVGLLLGAGADPNTSVKGGINSALADAAEGGDMNMVQLLVKHGADVNQAILYGHTPLMLADRAGHGDVARYLIDHGAVITPLHRFLIEVVKWTRKSNIQFTRINPLVSGENRFSLAVDYVDTRPAGDPYGPLVVVAIAERAAKDLGAKLAELSMYVGTGVGKPPRASITIDMTTAPPDFLDWFMTEDSTTAQDRPIYDWAGSWKTVILDTKWTAFQNLIK